MRNATRTRKEATHPNIFKIVLLHTLQYKKTEEKVTRLNKYKVDKVIYINVRKYSANKFDFSDNQKLLNHTLTCFSFFFA